MNSDFDVEDFLDCKIISKCKYYNEGGNTWIPEMTHSLTMEDDTSIVAIHPTVFEEVASIVEILSHNHTVIEIDENLASSGHSRHLPSDL